MPSRTVHKKFEKSPMDITELLNDAYESNIAGLADLPQEQNAAAKLRDEVFPKLGRMLMALDAAMKKLLLIDSDSEPEDLQEWNARMRSCDVNIDELAKNIHLLADEEWRWPSVIRSLAWIQAASDQSKATLRHNGVWIEGMPEKDA